MNFRGKVGLALVVCSILGAFGYYSFKQSWSEDAYQDSDVIPEIYSSEGDFNLDDLEGTLSDKEKIHAVVTRAALLASESSDEKFRSWMDQLSRRLLGEGEQSQRLNILEYQRTLPVSLTGVSYDFSIARSEPAEFIAPRDLDDGVHAARVEKRRADAAERESMLARVRLAAAIFKGLLEQDETVLSAINYLGLLDPVFTKVVTHYDEGVLQHRVEVALSTISAQQITQLMSCQKIQSTHLEFVIKDNDSLWVVPLAMRDPRTAGHLIGHLYNVINRGSKNRGADGYTAIMSCARALAERRGVVALAQFLGSVHKTYPCWIEKLGSDYEKILSNAWKRELKQNILDVAKMTKGHWDIVYDQSFLETGAELNRGERSILALGLRRFLSSHFDEFAYSSKDREALPERLFMKQMLSEKLRMYPAFHVYSLLSYRSNRHDFKEESSIVSDEIVSFLSNTDYPFYLRFEVANQAMDVRFKNSGELEKMASGYSAILRECAVQGNRWKPSVALPLLRNMRNRAREESERGIWSEECSKVVRSWLSAYSVPGNVLKTYNSYILKQLFLVAVASGDEELIRKMMYDHKAVMEGNISLIRCLMMDGKYEFARQLCVSKSTGSMMSGDSYPMFTGTSERALARLLEVIPDEKVRYYMEVILAGNDDDEKNNSPKVDRIDRLRALAGRYDRDNFSSRESMITCLEVLCSEPSIAYLLKDDLAEVIGGLGVLDFKRGSKAMDARGLFCFDAMLLFNAYLGNQVRDGKLTYVEHFIETLIAESDKGLDHGSWMLGDFLRVLHDHLLVLAKEGDTQAIGSCRLMTRKIYAHMIRSSRGHNYRPEAMTLNDFCHAAAKEFDQIKPWVDKLGAKAKKYHDLQRFYLAAKPMGGLQNPFCDLAKFHKFRGRWGRAENADFRRAAVLVLMGDSGLMKIAVPRDFLSGCTSVIYNGSPVLTHDDVFSILDTWATMHPEHKGWPYEDLRTIRLALKKAVSKRGVKRTSWLQLRKARAFIKLGKGTESKALLKTIKQIDSEPEVWESRERLLRQ